MQLSGHTIMPNYSRKRTRLLFLMHKTRFMSYMWVDLQQFASKSSEKTKTKKTSALSNLSLWSGLQIVSFWITIHWIQIEWCEFQSGWSFWAKPPSWVLLIQILFWFLTLTGPKVCASKLDGSYQKLVGVEVLRFILSLTLSKLFFFFF